jgi:hypothetical protein
VQIAQIQGTESREGDFTVEFRLLHRRTRPRWLRVAMAATSGLPLPPVKLIRVGESFFVRDGHHRFSVARALDRR